MADLSSSRHSNSRQTRRIELCATFGRTAYPFLKEKSSFPPLATPPMPPDITYEITLQQAVSSCICEYAHLMTHTYYSVMMRPDRAPHLLL